MWGTSCSLRPSAAESPVPPGPAMEASMTMARPAPPASCIVLRHSRIMCVLLVTSTTVSPVVVQPLTASNAACVKFSPSTIMKGSAENTDTMPQLRTTTTLPSCRSMADGSAIPTYLLSAVPSAISRSAGSRNPATCRASSGQRIRHSSGVSISTPESRSNMPV